MQQLGVNTIRVYNLAADLDHNECASIFNAAGIYMLLDVNSGQYGTYIDRSKPASTYTLTYLKHIFGIVEAFAPFPNLLGFFAGNEIINEDSGYEAPLYIRAVVRDLKEYISNNINREIGVGYSAADVSTMLTDTWNYLGCSLSNSTNSNIDFFGLNDYEWCGDSSFTKSGYSSLVEMFEGTNIPVFFSEYGCNEVTPRTFTNVPVLYGDDMSVLSGGLVYEWSEESDDYGLVTINSTDEIHLLSDYYSIKKEFAKIDTSSLTTVNKTAEAQSASSCATSMITETAFLNAWNIPDRPTGGDALVSSGISSSNPGSLVSVTATTMSASVYNTASTLQTGLALVILDSDDSNYPGLIDNYTSSGKSQTQTDYGSSNSSSSSSSNSSSSSDKSSAASSSYAVLNAGAVAVAGFVVSLLVL